MRGAKAVCSKTRKLGRRIGDNVQVFYDAEDDSVFGIYQMMRDFAVYSDDRIIYVATYYRPATQRQIEKDTRMAIANAEVMSNLNKSSQKHEKL